jgi:hypothetical protein
LLLSGQAAQAQQTRPGNPLRPFEERLEQAQAGEISVLAPARFSEVRKVYSEAELIFRKTGKIEAVRPLLQRAEQALIEAQRSADQVRERLSLLLAIRDETNALEGVLKTRTAQADALLAQAAARAEAGDAGDLIQAAEQEYRRAAAGHLYEGSFRQLRNALEQARPDLPEAVLRQAQADTAALEKNLLAAALGPRVLNDHLIKIWEWLFPPFFRNPPTMLIIDGFTLYVESYESKAWDFKNNRIIGASGIAWLSFNCNPFPFPWWQGIAVTEKRLQVVDSVTNGLEQISLADAQKLDSTMKIGSALEVALPIYASNALQVQRSIKDLIRFRPLGDIKLQFENLTIQQGGQQHIGIVLAGGAIYPTVPPQPARITLSIEGFRLYLDSLKISTTGATAEGELEFPVSIVDPGTGHPGRVKLGSIAITQACRFHKELPDLTYGPWSVGNTEMVIQGTGVVADFDKTWAPPGVTASSAASQPGWQGALLGKGTTVPASGAVVSNTAYLRASYSFPQAEVVGSGLQSTFQLTAPYEFTTLQPFGYRVMVATGSVTLIDSAVSQAQFLKNTIVAPLQAARAALATPVRADASTLQVDSNLEMFGVAPVATPVIWGEFTRNSPGLLFYETRDFIRGFFYLTGTNHTNFFPIDGVGQFITYGNAALDVRGRGMRGLTTYGPRRLSINTPDTPKPSPLRFIAGSDEVGSNWLNISFGGVHADLRSYLSEPGSSMDLGPMYQPFYAGKAPFVAAMSSNALLPSLSSYRLDIRFASSAVYDSDMRGTLQIPQPVNSTLDFEEMAFTSTAQISGARLPFNNPLKLSYWGLDMVKKPGAISAGVLCVRCGQVFFTSAGIREQRHFTEPFYLIWGEMLANGALNRLVFDYSGVGQRFDKFPYVTSFVRLSDYDPANPAKPAFLKTAGTVHFDFFGAKYVNIENFYDPSKPGDPFNNRRIDALSVDSDPGGLFGPSVKTLAGNWSSDFGSMNYTYDYDKNAQDGFLGAGQMSLLWIDSAMSSSIVIKHDRMCMSVNETTRRDLKLGPVAHFGAMHRITGCGCISNGQLERINLSAELETQGNANIVLRSAGYGYLDLSLTPSVSKLEIGGDFFVTVLAGGDVQVTGTARFTVDRANDFVEGEVNGKFNTSSAMGFNSITGDGQLNWHIGTLGGQGYQSIQGRIAVKVITPVAGAAAEGGFYIGINAPKNEAWVLANATGRFALNMAPLPARLTGAYGYVKASDSVNAFIFSGGIEAYVGLGGFVLTPAQVANLGAQSSGLPVGGLPFVIGHVGVHIWGEILGGLVSAGGWVDMQVMGPYPFSCQGTLGLEGCVLWVFCGSVDVTVGLNSSEGLFVK